MIVPSIDLSEGQAVQLVGGKTKVLEAGDPRPLMEKFARVGEVAVIDLDAAMGRGSNREIIRELLRLGDCRVGGGIRDVKTAVDWLDAGAARVILGTAARPEILSQLPKERVIAALDAVHGEVVVEGWQTATGQRVEQRIAELAGLVGGFLLTFVEREGRLQGIDLETTRKLIELAGSVRITAAGGITTCAEIAELDRMGADAQVGMALYTGKMDLADALAAPLKTDRPDGLWPTVVVDEHDRALGLVYSSGPSLRRALAEGRGIYQSRSRGLWIKGESSGNTQKLLRVDLDCDRDCLRFRVLQQGGGFCHTGSRTCWGEDRGLTHLLRLLHERRHSAPEGSYTRRLFSDPELLSAKLREEARELAEAQTPEQVAWEAADLFYFTLVAMARADVGLDDVEFELLLRNRKITRRPGDAKPTEDPQS